MLTVQLTSICLPDDLFYSLISFSCYILAENRALVSRLLHSVTHLRALNSCRIGSRLLAVADGDATRETNRLVVEQLSIPIGDQSILELIDKKQQLLMEDSMDFNIGIENTGVGTLQELWNKVAFEAMCLVRETRNVVIEKDSLQKFSSSISELSTVLRALDARKVEAAMGTDSARVALETLHCQLKKAQEVIKGCKSGSHFRLLLQSRLMLVQMQGLAKDIARTLSSFQLVNLDVMLNLKSRTDEIIRNLSSMELQSVVATEAIASEIESSFFQNCQNQKNAVKLLEKIAEVGAPADASLVHNELTLLQQEKEQMEDQRKQAEALQLSQLIQLLHRTELVMRPRDAYISTHHQSMINSFTCLLCNEMMSDPVTIYCGHSFERKAIQDHFNKGQKNCPTCQEDLLSLELTPNINLRNSIEEWKQKDTNLRFCAAISAIKSDDHGRQNIALNDIQNMVEEHQYATTIFKDGLIPKIVDFLEDNRLDNSATLKCLLLLAKHCDEHKEALVEAGVVRCIVKQMYKGGKDPNAVAVLLELSKVEALRDKIGSKRACIPLLVSLLDNKNPDISQKAQEILENLSDNTSFVVKMAEAGYFQPFVARFIQGPQESRALMATNLVKLQLKEKNVKHLKDRKFINNLLKMLSSNSPAYKLICLKIIRNLTAFPKMVKRLLSDALTIPSLLGLVSFARSDSLLKEEAGSILASLIGSCQHSEFQTCQGLMELQSEHNLSLFLQLVASSHPPTKIQFLHLLVELGYKSEAARNQVRANSDAIIHLFSLLDADKPSLRRWVMKLVHSISDGHPDGVPLPQSPWKENAVSGLVAIFTSSPNTEERILAAAIISQLPRDDIAVDKMLRKSEMLKAIREVICNLEEEHNWVASPVVTDTALLENALAALLRFTEPTKPELQRQVGKLELYPSLVRILSRGSSLAKKQTAIALAQLSQSTSLLTSEATIKTEQARSSMPPLHFVNLMPNMFWCCSSSSEYGNLCPVHHTACSATQTFCLVKADAVKPLVCTLSETEPGVVEAAITALETLLIDHRTLSHATAVIVESQGVVAILQVLEKGSLSTKIKALDILQKILEHNKINDPRCERVLIQLLHENALKKKVALLLKQMGIIPEQSSYF